MRRQRFIPARLGRIPARLVYPLLLVWLITAIGTLGYTWLGRPYGRDWFDALYMTIITITTIGYGEVIPLDTRGRVFTMVIAVTGIGSLFYWFSAVMDYMVGQRLLELKGGKRMQREIDHLSGHIVLAGLGRVGKQAAQELAEAERDFVVVDPADEARRHAEERDWYFVQGDASDDAVLLQAGIDRAFGMIVTTGHDAHNLYTVLSARVLNPGLYIVSRAADENSATKLARAGANRTISPYAIGGRRLAHLILSPTVVDFFDTVLRRGAVSLNLEDIRVRTDSPVVGATLESLDLRHRCGASVLAVFRGTQMIPNPAPELRLQSDDRLLAIGTIEQLDRLEELVGQR